MRSIFVLVLSALMFNTPTWAQSGPVPSSPVSVLAFSEFMNWVLAYHPVARQADLIPESAEAKLLKARGGFDPKLYAFYDDKEYEGDNYWDIGEVGVDIPTRTGVKIKGSYNINNGVFLNPERSIPTQGQALLGVSVPLGRGAFIDNRRAALREAFIYQELSQEQRYLMLNDLLMDAAKAYIDWAGAVRLLNRYENAEERSEIRFNGLRANFFQGENSAADTLEALTQLQNFQVMRSQANAEALLSQAYLSTFLWSQENYPLTLDSAIRPIVLIDSSLFSSNTESMLLQRIGFIDSHPLLKTKNYKVDILNIDRRLGQEYLKPEVNVNYNLLTGKSAQISAEQFSLGVQPNQNYKLGLEINFPLLFRKERGDLQMTKIKIQDEQLSIAQKRVELQNKIRMENQQLLAYKRQLKIQSENVVNLRRLLFLEEAKFQAGESNLFLINSREQKLIESQQKLILLLQKYHLTESKLLWTSALLVDAF